MGKVKTEQIKNLAKELITRYPAKFSGNFDENKLSVNELTKGMTTRVRNKVAGYITRTVSLTQKDTLIDEEIIEDLD